jgi:hypothetical protein
MRVTHQTATVLLYDPGDAYILDTQIQLSSRLPTYVYLNIDWQVPFIMEHLVPVLSYYYWLNMLHISS